MIEISLLDWGGVSCAVVHDGPEQLAAFCGRIGRRAPVTVKFTKPLDQQAGDPALLAGWRSAVRRCGAVWATGFSASLGGAK